YGVVLARDEVRTPDPRDVGILGTTAVVASAEGRSHAIKESWLAWLDGTGLVNREHRAALTVLREDRIRERRLPANTDHVPARRLRRQSKRLPMPRAL